MRNRLLPWSYTKLDTFKQCPRRVYEIYVLGNKEPPTQAMLEGTDVHKSFEDSLVGNRPLPRNLQHHEKFVIQLKNKQANGYHLCAEKKFGVTQNYKATGFFGDDVWGRGAADVVVTSPDKRLATILDWKTGNRREQDAQVGILALFAFCEEPQLEKVTTANIWLKENVVGTTYVFTRDNLPSIKTNIERTLEDAQTCQDKDNWESKPSGLCKFCHVKTCRFNKRND